jgi:aspartate aminotransferase
VVESGAGGPLPDRSGEAMTVDVSSLVPSGDAAAAFAADALNPMSQGLQRSRILAIAAEIRGLIAEGKDVCNLTVGDFKPAQFSIPDALRDGTAEALAAGQTNYPPAVGVPELRQAVRDLYERQLGLNYPTSSVLVGSGARPPIFATAALVLQPGDRVLYGIPSWNNHHYVHINRCLPTIVHCDASTDFLLTAELIAPRLEGVTLLCLNSPLNPCGTAYTAEQLGAICDVVLQENARREAEGERPVMLMYDQVYWMLVYGETAHVNPVSLRPEMAKYTIFVDAISKAFAATGLRVGWAVVPPPLAPAYQALIGHMGAWAPRPEQLATAALLNDEAATEGYLTEFRGQLEARLQALHDGFTAMGAKGLPIRSIAPQGAIYLSVHVDALGKSGRGRTLTTDDDVRSYLLHEGGMGVVPFTAFGIPEDTGWIRLSVGAVGLDDIERCLARLEPALADLS